MKKLYSIAVVSMSLIAATAFGQSQRFILAEEFTQASCGPCAAQNPGFNAVLEANTTKIIGLKYQVWWPGYDPMYNHNKSEVNTRVAYYGVTGVPNVRVDGTAYTGAPSGVTQSFVDNRYTNVSSPYTIDATHSFNANYTQMTINADIACTQATSGTLVAHVAVIEREINFATAPGTNGETEFFGVMKKMLPTDQGTPVTAVALGNTQNINLTFDIPWYVYNLNQLAAIVFIQNTTSKVVHQCDYSQPIGGLPSVDMAITNVTGVPTLICAGTFSPAVTIKNNAATTLTSCNVNYQIDGGAVVAQPWTGSLAQNATAVVNLTNISAGNGTHSLRIFTSDLNAGVDIAPLNNNNFKTFSYSITATQPPIVEGFAPAVFPPVDWIVNDNNADGIGWSRVTNAGGFSATGQCAKMDFYNSTNGRIDELFVKKLDLTGLGGTASMGFDVAYKQYSTENDRLEVFVSTNCGTNWTSVFNKAGSVLSTSPGGQTSAFVPNASQWRAESVDLTSYLGMSEVLVKFKATSNYGNNLYVDNINILTVGMAEATLDKAINLYPTLTTGVVNLEASFDKTQNLTVSVFNTMGQEVSTQSYQKTLGGSFVIDLSNVANGNYSVRIMTDEAAITKQISVAK
jgi:hypothetical protein